MIFYHLDMCGWNMLHIASSDRRLLESRLPEDSTFITSHHDLEDKFESADVTCLDGGGATDGRNSLIVALMNAETDTPTEADDVSAAGASLMRNSCKHAH